MKRHGNDDVYSLESFAAEQPVAKQSAQDPTGIPVSLVFQFVHDALHGRYPGIVTETASC
jgi:hypothetical protein